MSPTAFVRRPERWIQALSDESRHAVSSRGPNFAYEWTAAGVPADNEHIDLSNV